MPSVLIVNSPGPQGPVGPQGPAGPTGSFDSGSFITTGSFNAFTGSYNTGSFTGSFKGDGSNLYNIPSSGITGLNLSQIASGSVTASISPSNGFVVNTSASISGSLVVNGGITGSLFGTASYVPTLAQVTTAGNTTTNSISVGSIAIGATSIPSLSGKLYVVENATNGVITIQNSNAAGWTSFQLNNNNGTLVGGFGWGNASAAVLNNTMYFDVAGNNPFIIRTNGSERIRFFGNGNVGINTTTDAGYKLDVNGTGRFSGNLTITGSATNSLLVKGSGTTSATNTLLVQNANASSSLVVLDNGYVGINTGSAAYNLDVNGTARVSGDFYLKNGFYLTNSLSGQARLGILPPSNGINSFIDLFPPTATGNVDVGVVVWGKGSPSNITNYELLEFRYDNTNRRFAFDTLAQGTGTVLPLVFYTQGNNNQFVLQSNGNIGIGTNIALAKFQVTGSITASSALAQGVYFNNTLVASASNDTLVGLDIQPTFNTGSFTGVTKLALRTSGDVLITGSLTIQPTSSATQLVSIIQAGSGSIALVPLGYTAIMASIPDGTATGGNARGLGATDFQRVRSSATQVASGDDSTIGGGLYNTAGYRSTVAGGYNNTAGLGSAVGGGITNSATGNYTTVSGGNTNTASSNYSSVLGGQSNTASTNTHATVVGGYSNTASGQYSVTGGYFAVASGQFSISLGRQSTASSSDSIAFGRGNTASGGSSFAIGQNSSAIANYAEAHLWYGYGYLFGQNSYGVGGDNLAITSANTGRIQYSYLTAFTQAVLSTGGTQGVYLDGNGSSGSNSGLIIPSGTNRAWNTKVESVAVVTATSGSTTGVSVGDTYMQDDTLLFKKIGGTSSVVGVNNTNLIADNSMATAGITYTTGSAQDLLITFTAPTFSGGGTVTCRVVSKVSLVEVAY